MSEPNENLEKTKLETQARLFTAISKTHPKLTEGLTLDKTIELIIDEVIDQTSNKGQRKGHYVNALRKSIRKNGNIKIELDTTEDSIMMNLRVHKLDSEGKLSYKNGKPETLVMRCLIDSGATISCLARRFREQHNETFERYLDQEAESMNVTFANDDSETSGNAYSGIHMYESHTRAGLAPPTLHELTLPSGVDCLLGIDWLKQYNPYINWKTGCMEFEHNTASKRFFNPVTGRHRACWVKKAKDGLIAMSEMQRIIDSGETPVYEVTIKDTRKIAPQIIEENPSKTGMSGAQIEALNNARVRIAQAKRSKGNQRVLKTKTLTRQRMDVIFQENAEAKLSPLGGEETPAPKVDPRHNTGQPKMFLTQPETPYPEANKVINSYASIHVEDMEIQHVESHSANSTRAEVLQHSIELEPGSKPINRSYYRMTAPELAELKRQIEKYLATGMIRPSNSPYGSACLFAPKKNGKLRFVIDYRPLNNMTVKNAVQPAGVDDCLNQMGGSRIFSAMDLAQGYNQIPIKEEDRHKTAFNTKYGHYEWNVMPFGLCNSPATFTNALNRIFSGDAHRGKSATAYGTYEETNAGLTEEQLKEKGENLLDTFVTVYIDDLLIYSKTPEEHAEHLRRVFARLKEYGLLVQSPKSFYCQTEVDYLGHIISGDGIKVQSDKTDTIRDWPQPTEVTHVRQFLGLTGFYRKFVNGYSKIAAPLSNLTKKTEHEPSGAITWTPELEKAFNALKDALCSAPVLTIPNYQKGNFHINCDACEFGLGATLSQKGEDGKLHPCAFISRVLKPSERKRYLQTQCVYELELAGLIFALEKWRYYLVGQVGTTVDTDHKSLIWLKTQRELTKTQSQYTDLIARYDLQISYLKGELNIPGDAPSRRPDYAEKVAKYGPNTTDEIQLENEKLIKRVRELEATQKHSVRAILSARNMELHAWLARIEAAYSKDPLYQNRKENHEYTQIENHGFKLWYHITSNDDLPPTVCIPNDSHIRNIILKEFHEPPTIGHYNGADMFSKMSRTYFWKEMRTDCLKTAKTCTICQPHKPARFGKQGLLATPEFPELPWDSVALDFFGPLAKHSQKAGKDTPDRILVAVCRLTKMAHYIPVSSTAKADEIADLLIDHVIKLHGIPRDFRSDRDTIFTSAFWNRVWTRLGTSLSLSTAYHHQTAGQVERVNQEMRRYLAIYCKSHADWHQHLGLAELAYNSHINSSTGCTPFELNYGFQPRNPSDLLTPEPLREETIASAAEKKAISNGDGWLTKLHKNWVEAQAHVRESYRKHERFYDRHHKDTSLWYPVGSKVYLRSRDLSLTTAGRETILGQDEYVKRKFLPYYLGPFVVTEISGKNNLNRKLKLSTTLAEKLSTNEFHISKLKPMGERDEPFTVADLIPPHLGADPEIFHVEKICAFEQRAQGKRYLIKWEGYPSSANTWEWEWNLENAEERLRDFYKTRPTEKNPSRRSTRQRVRCVRITSSH